MKPTIVIITEDVIFPYFFKILLYRSIPDLDIIICNSYGEIEDKLNSLSCQLVVLDGGLSNMSSSEIIRQIRNISIITGPIWVFPEFQMSSFIDKLFNNGATRILERPFDPYVLTNEMTTVLIQNSI